MELKEILAISGQRVKDFPLVRCLFIIIIGKNRLDPAFFCLGDQRAEELLPEGKLHLDQIHTAAL